MAFFLPLLSLFKTPESSTAPIPQQRQRQQQQPSGGGGGLLQNVMGQSSGGANALLHDFMGTGETPQSFARRSAKKAPQRGSASIKSPEDEEASLLSDPSLHHYIGKLERRRQAGNRSLEDSSRSYTQPATTAYMRVPVKTTDYVPREMPRWQPALAAGIDEYDF
jgi:hypothetical protein